MPEVSNKASTVKNVFSRETTVSVDIHAEPKVIWSLLTQAQNYSKWNSTVISIDGVIALGEKIQLISYLDPKRVFKLTIKEFEPGKKLVWGDPIGNREYILTPQSGGMTRFTMTEKIGGPLFPLFASMIPSFDESFDTFASDLKNASEK
jgi:uncharacterized protein YndB with AHSA1/START domain